MDSTGSQVLFATYVGAALAAVALDSSGNIYIAGASYAGFPLVNPVKSAYAPCGQDSCTFGFIAALNPQGSALLFATFVGGGADSLVSMAMGPGGSIVFAGDTFSTSLPVTAQAFQKQVSARKCSGCPTGFVGVLAPVGTALAFLTYLGGSGSDTPAGVGVDATGAVYIAGSTASKDFPTTAGAFQPKPVARPAGTNGFVTKLNPTGSQLVYSTYLGGSSGGNLYALAVQGQNAYVAGASESNDFPVTPGAFRTTLAGPSAPNAVVAELSADGSSLAYSTYLDDSTQPSALTVRPGVAYVTGFTYSTSFPVVNAVQGGTLSAIALIVRPLSCPAPTCSSPR